MSPRTYIVLLRVVGTIAALEGILQLYFNRFMLQTIAEMDHAIMWLMYVILGFMSVIAVYLIWVGYLVWFRFSPSAVRHCCAALAYGIFVISIAAAGFEDRDQAGVWAISPLVVLVLVWWGYRVLSRYLNRIIFAEGNPGLP